MKKIVLLVFLLLTLLPSKSQAIALNLGERLIIQSKVLAEERELQVLLPENYHANANAKATYPVIYLVDGDYNFHGASGMLDVLAGKGQLIPDVILVGIGDKGTSLYRQYMTPSVYGSEAKPSKGRAAEFLRFITEEVQPAIAKNYRNAEHSTLVGQSMGGLFVLNALLEKPAAFNNYVAISPSVWIGEQGIVQKAKEKLAKTQHAPVNLFISLADETRMAVYEFLNVLDLDEPKNIDWSFKHYSDENHNSIGLIALRDSLKTTYQDWYISEKQLTKFKNPELIVEHYKSLMTRFDFSQPIPTPSIKAMVRYHYRNDKVTELGKFIEHAIKKLPASKQAFIAMQASYVGHFDSPKAALVLLTEVEQEFAQSIEHVKAIANTFEQLDNKKMALKYFQKAQVLAKEQQANQWQLNIIQAKLNLLAK